MHNKKKSNVRIERDGKGMYSDVSECFAMLPDKLFIRHLLCWLFRVFPSSFLHFRLHRGGLITKRIFYLRSMNSDVLLLLAKILSKVGTVVVFLFIH